MKAPCKDCPDRHYLCHSHCEKYIAFNEFRIQERERTRKENQLRNDIFATTRHSKKIRMRPYYDKRYSE